MDRDALAERDVADDLVARDRRAALGQPHEDALGALDGDPEVGARGRLRLRLERDDLFLGHLRRLQPSEHLLDDLADRELARAERDVEVLGLLEAGLADHLREHRRARELAVRQLLGLQRLLERLAPLVLGVLTRLAREPLADLVPCARRAGERHPVARRAAAALRRQDLDEVAAVQRVVERNDPPVDLRADRAVPDVRVHRVREVDRRRPRGQRLDLALRREHVHLVVEEVGAEALDELARVGFLVPPLHQLLHPLEPLLVGRLACRPGLYEYQWAAIPNSAPSCISRVRIWISSGLPAGPTTVVCSAR